MLKAASKKKRKRIDTYNALQFESDQARRCKAAWPYAVLLPNTSVEPSPFRMRLLLILNEAWAKTLYASAITDAI